MALIDPNTVIVGENFWLGPNEDFETALKTRCIHRFTSWSPFARGSRRWCVDCKGSEIFTPRLYKGVSSTTKFHAAGTMFANEKDFLNRPNPSPLTAWEKK